MYLFKPKGVSTFLQMHDFLFLKEEYSDTTMFYCPNSFKSITVDGSPKQWRFLKSTKWMNPPKRVKILIHKVDGSPREGENSYKSNTWTDIN